MEKALELGEEKIYIILSHTQDNKKNPLVDDKQRLTLTNLSKQYSPEYLNGNNVQEIEGIKYVKIGKKYFKLK